jgi:hypothetical protein
MSFRVLSARDLIAFIVVACRSVASGPGTAVEPTTLVGYAYTVADAFVEQSVSRWAADERQNRKPKS